MTKNPSGAVPSEQKTKLATNKALNAESCKFDYAATITARLLDRITSHMLAKLGVSLTFLWNPLINLLCWIPAPSRPAALYPRQSFRDS